MLLAQVELLMVPLPTFHFSFSLDDKLAQIEHYPQGLFLTNYCLV